MSTVTELKTFHVIVQLTTHIYVNYDINYKYRLDIFSSMWNLNNNWYVILKTKSIDVSTQEIELNESIKLYLVHSE